jgi:hypothetical protein
MPLVHDNKPVVMPNKDAPGSIKPLIPETTPKPYYGTSVDTRFVPRSTLLTFIAGASWTVEYYSSVLGKDSELKPEATDLAAVYQQYTKIVSLELKVTKGLESSQDAQTKVMTVNGSANVYPGLIPNMNDMFIANDADGRRLVLTITNSTKMSIQEDAAYAIDYMVVGYADAPIGTPPVTRQADLNRKTLKTIHFLKDYLYHGRNPFMIEEDYYRMSDLSKLYRRLLADFLGTFFSTEYQCLLVPDQAMPTYDPFMNDKVLAWFSQDEHPYLQRIKPLNVNSDLVFKSTTVLDAIEQMDANLLATSIWSVLLANTGYLRDYPALNGIFWSGVRQVVYPQDRRTDVDRNYEGPYASTVYGQRLQKGGPRYRTMERVIVENNLGDINYIPENDHTLPDIVPVTASSHYIFSKNFYQRSGGPLPSNFEVMVSEALEGKAIDGVVLARLATNAHLWQNLERFYYVPILLALIKVTLIRGS